MNYIWLISSNLGLLYEIKIFLIKNVKMVGMNKLTYVISIKIFSDRYQELLRLFQKEYINRVLEKFSIQP